MSEWQQLRDEISRLVFLQFLTVCSFSTILEDEELLKYKMSYTEREKGWKGVCFLENNYYFSTFNIFSFVVSILVFKSAIKQGNFKVSDKHFDSSPICNLHVNENKLIVLPIMS